MENCPCILMRLAGSPCHPCMCVCRQTTHKDRAEKEICTNRISIPDETLRYSSVVVGVTHEMECEGAKKL